MKMFFCSKNIKCQYLLDGHLDLRVKSDLCLSLDRKGRDIHTVSNLLEYSSVRVTERHYLALIPAYMREAVNHLSFDVLSDTDG